MNLSSITAFLVGEETKERTWRSSYYLTKTLCFRFKHKYIYSCSLLLVFWLFASAGIQYTIHCMYCILMNCRRDAVFTVFYDVEIWGADLPAVVLQRCSQLHERHFSPVALSAQLQVLFCLFGFFFLFILCVWFSFVWGCLYSRLPFAHLL